jgi:radical SAM protein with 4Fe4S-binding SPASM domain
MSPENFEKAVEKIRAHTNYVYLHILGEPLLHPHFSEIVKIAVRAGLQVNLTTNGSLLSQQFGELQDLPIRQINISLHDAEENYPQSKWENYFDEVLVFAKKISEKTFINLRLWNGKDADSDIFNQLFFEKYNAFFGSSKPARIFIDSAPRFHWADGTTIRHADNIKKCYALRDHIGILVDGTVVPCCLDADGAMALGNIFTDELSEIIASPRAQKIANGFKSNKITEDFCKTCGFLL